jgi:hypothetical protein
VSDLASIREASRAMSHRFGLGGVTLSEVTRVEEVTVTVRDGEVISKEREERAIDESIGPNQSETYARGELKIDLHVYGERLTRATLKTTGRYRPAAEFWAELVADRVPTAQISIEQV